MPKLKTPLICAGVSCVLSMFIGMINGVRVLNIIMRGLIAGVTVGGFVFCAAVLLKKYIPDLFAQQSYPDAAGTLDPDTGANVNITLDDEAQDASGLDSGTPAAGMQSSSDSAAEAAFPISDTASELNEPAVSEMPVDNAAAGIEKTETSAPAASAPTAAAKHSGSNDPLLSDLPSVGEFMGPDDEETPVIQESADAAVPGADGEFLVNQSNPITSDTKVMAQAIRTVLTTGD